MIKQYNITFYFRDQEEYFVVMNTPPQKNTIVNINGEQYIVVQLEYHFNTDNENEHIDVDVYTQDYINF